MQKTISKILSCLLALVMVLGLLPVSSLAAEMAAATIYKNGVLQASYADVQSAVDNSNGGVIVLEKNVNENITVSGEVYLDLNGKTLTGNVSGTGTLYGMDTANDTYDAAKNGRITGTVSCAVASNCKNDATLKRYVAIADADGYSFHRIYAGITKQSLAPSVTGVGYKAEFYADATVLEQVDSIGYDLWLEGYSVLSRSTSFKNQLTLRVKNFDAENFGATKLYAAACITIGGEKIRSSQYSLTLRQVVEDINANVGAYTQTQLQAVRDMITANPVMENWQIENIFRKVNLVTVAFSDVQLVTSPRGATTNGPKTLRDHLNYAKSIDADVLFMPGDIVNNVDQSYYDRFWSIFQSVYGTDKSQWPELVWTMGNHEWYDLNEKTATNAISMFKANAKIESDNLVKMSQVASQSNPGQTVVNYYKVINGVPFVVISGDGMSMKVSDAQKAELIGWLDEINELPSVKAGSPIYVAYHGPISDVTFFGQGTSDESKVVDAILKNYPNTIVFTGHTHYANINERTINQIDYTAINLGSSSYSRIASRSATSQAGDKYYNAGGSDKDVVNGEVSFGYEYVQNLMVLQNNTDGSVNMDRYITDSNSADARKVGITWNFPAGLTKDKFIYTNARFENKQWANALYGKDGLTFADNADIAYSVKGSEMMVYFDDVTDHNCAEHYKITVTADGKTSKTYDFVGNYYKYYEEAQTYHFVLSDIPAGTNYKVEVKAYDFFDNESLNSLVATTENATSLFPDVVDENLVSTYTDISTKVNYEVTAGSISSVEAFYQGDYLYTYGATLGTVLNKDHLAWADNYSVTNWSHGILTVKVKNVGDAPVNIGLSVKANENGTDKWLTDFGGAYRKVVQPDGQWTELTWDLKALFGMDSLNDVSGIAFKASSTAASADGYTMHLYLDDIDILQGENVTEPDETIRGEAFTADVSLVKNFEGGHYSTVSFDYKITKGGKIAVFLRGEDAWLNSYGNFNFNANGAQSNYPGVTTQKLDDGYIRVTLEIAKLTEIFNNKPNGICALEIFGSWSDAEGYFDNLQLTVGETPSEPEVPADRGEAFTAGTTKTFYLESEATDTISFEYKLTTEGKIYVILRAPDWSSYYGDFTFDANGLVYTYQTGITCEKLNDGYIRVTMKLSELNRSNLNDNRDKAPASVGILDIYDWGTASGYVDNICIDGQGTQEPEEDVIRGQSFTAEDGITIELGSTRALTQFSFEYKLTTGDNMAITLRNNDWSANYYGVFQFNPNGASDKYDGVTTEKLSDGYVRVTFDMAALTKFSGTPGEIISRFCVYANWTNTDGYIDNIKKVYVPLERGDAIAAGQDWVASTNAAAYENVFFDYRITNGGKIAVVLMDDNGRDYFGKFYFAASGATENYAGVSTLLRADGYTKVSFDIAQLAKHSGTAPDKIAAIKILGADSTATGYADSATFKTQMQPEGIRVGIISDTHIKYASYSDKREYNRLINALTEYKEMGVDAIIVAGDLQYYDNPTGDDSINEPKASIDSFAQAWFTVFPNNTNPLTGEHVEPVFIYGNHDAYLTAEKYWPSSLGEYSDAYVKEVKGYYFVGAHYGMEAQAIDLVSFAQEESNGYPFFYVQHDTMENTLYGIQSNYTSTTKPVTEALYGVSNAVAFTGHYHLPSTDERSIWQPSDNNDPQFTAISVPSTYYATVEDLPGLHFDNNINVVQGMYMVVDGTDVTITRMDFTNDCTQIGEDWSFDAADPTDRPYGYETRAKDVKVSFAADAKAQVSMSGQTMTVTFPAATVTVPAGFSDQIHAYYVDVVDLNTGNVVKTEGILTDYICNDKPENFAGPYTVTITGLDANGNYEVRVYAKDFLQVSSQPLVATTAVAGDRGDAFDVGQSVVKYFEGANYATVSFDYKITSGGKIAVFLRGNDAWLNSYGNFNFNANGAMANYAGVTTQVLSDGYIRVTLKIAELTEIYNNKPNGISALEVFGSWSDATGYIDNVQCSLEGSTEPSEPEQPTEPAPTEPAPTEPTTPAIRGEIYTAGEKINYPMTEGDYATISFDYKLTTDGYIRVMLRSPSDSECYGSFYFTADGEREDYTGVVCEKLSDGYIRVTVTTAEVSITGNSDGREKVPATVSKVCVYRDSTASGYIDNIQFTEKDPSEEQYRGTGFIAGATANVTLSATVFREITFEYKLTTAGEIAVALRSPSDVPYYGLYYFDAKGLTSSNKAGITTEKLEDGYIRVKMVLAELNKTNNSDNRDNVPETVSKLVFYKYGTASGYVDNVELKLPPPERGDALVAGQNWSYTTDAADYEQILVDYRLTGGGQVAFALTDATQSNYYGYYYFDADGEVQDYAGVSTMARSDEYTKITFDVAQLAKTSGVAPSQIAKIVVIGSESTATGFVDYVQFKESATPTGVRFGVLSDIHVGVFEDDQYTVRFIHALTAYRDRGVDAVLISGDLQNHTTDYELSKKWIEVVADAWFTVFPDNTNPLTGEHVEPVLICGNHDQQLVAEKYWPERFGEYTDAFIKEVNGYYFVGANFWREEAATNYISYAKEDSNGYPFFYTQHCTLYNTVYNITDSGHGTAETNLKTLWDAYNAVTFTGHTHIPATDERSIWHSLSDKDPDFTAIQVPSLNYGRLSDLGLDAPGNTDLCEQGMYVVVEGTQVNVTRIDFSDHSNTTGEQMGAVWSFDAGDPTDRPYDYNLRASQVSKPEFGKNAKITVKYLSKSQIKISIPTATVTAPEGFSDAIQLYYVELVDVATGKVIQTDTIETMYMYNLKPENLAGPYATTFFDLQDNTAYQIRVYAQEFYQVKSEPLTLDFNTADGVEDVVRGQAFEAEKGTNVEFTIGKYEALSFDYRLTGPGEMVIVLRSPDWIPYYGTYSFNMNGPITPYDGVYYQFLDDNYVRVTMVLSELTKTNGNDDRENAPDQLRLIDIYDWTTSNGYFDNLQLYKTGETPELPVEPEQPEIPEEPEVPEVTMRGERFEAGVGLTKYLSNVNGDTITPIGIVSFDYKLDEEATGDKTKTFGLILRRASEGNWTNTYKNYTFRDTGTRYTYDNVTCETLEDGYIHVTIDMTGFEYDDYGVFDVYDSWATVGGYIDNIQWTEAPVKMRGERFEAGEGLTKTLSNVNGDTITPIGTISF
ncbi:MAG: metallophosphoesterase family protein, partial [Oscillospiraceae bacterium]|nr:metallophosphoesterase family protein [Oscillospiraceae bacterium]